MAAQQRWPGDLPGIRARCRAVGLPATCGAIAAGSTGRGRGGPVVPCRDGPRALSDPAPGRRAACADRGARGAGRDHCSAGADIGPRGPPARRCAAGHGPIPAEQAAPFEGRTARLGGLAQDLDQRLHGPSAQAAGTGSDGRHDAREHLGGGGRGAAHRGLLRGQPWAAPGRGHEARAPARRPDLVRLLDRLAAAYLGWLRGLLLRNGRPLDRDVRGSHDRWPRLRSRLCDPHGAGDGRAVLRRAAERGASGAVRVDHFPNQGDPCGARLHRRPLRGGRPDLPPRNGAGRQAPAGARRGGGARGRAAARDRRSVRGRACDRHRQARGRGAMGPSDGSGYETARADRLVSPTQIPADRSSSAESEQTPTTPTGDRRGMGTTAH